MGSNRPIATLFSFVWVFSMMMILINVFIAILLDAYTDLKEEKDEEAKKHGEKEEGFSQITKQFTSYMKRATKKLQIVKRTLTGVGRTSTHQQLDEEQKLR